MCTSDFERLENFMLWSVTERQSHNGSKYLVVSLTLNNTVTLGSPVAYGERDPGSQLMVAWSGELQANPGCPTHSCCPEMAAAGCSQARERCKGTCVHLAPSLPEQEPLWAELWTGRGAGLIALQTLPEQLFPISSGGKGLWGRAETSSCSLGLACRPRLVSAELTHPRRNCAENYLLLQDLYILISMVWCVMCGYKWAHSESSFYYCFEPLRP